MIKLLLDAIVISTLKIKLLNTVFYNAQMFFLNCETFVLRLYI